MILALVVLGYFFFRLIRWVLEQVGEENLPNLQTTFKRAKIYRVNLDESIHNQWEHIITDHRQNIINSYVSLETRFNFDFLICCFPKTILWLIDSKLYETCLTVAKLLGDKRVKVQGLFFLNFMYESSAYCTSIVYHDTKTQYNYHQRVVDYFFVNEIHSLIIEVHYFIGGKLSYKATSFAGLSGNITVYKPGKYCITVNQRNTLNCESGFESVIGIVTNIFYVLVMRYYRVTQVIDDVMIKCENYQSAVKYLKAQKLISPVYFIVSDPKSNACILEMCRYGLHNQYDLFHDKNNYLICCNNDQDQRDKTKRMPTIKRCINSIHSNKKKSTTDYLFNEVMLIFPVFSKEETIYASLVEHMTQSYTSLIFDNKLTSEIKKKKSRVY